MYIRPTRGNELLSGKLTIIDDLMPVWQGLIYQSHVNRRSMPILLEPISVLQLVIVVVGLRCRLKSKSSVAIANWFGSTQHW